MYRVNFYREFEEKKQEVRRGFLRTAGLSAVAGLVFLLIILLGVNTFLVREKARIARSDIDKLTARLEIAPASGAAADAARQMIAIRRGRTDWAPKLAALSCFIGRDVMLEELSAQAADKRSPQRLELSGIVREGSQTEAVSAFIDSLRSAPAIIGDFSEITLERMEGGGTGSFVVVCEPRKADS
jgi:hypothetical protein